MLCILIHSNNLDQLINSTHFNGWLEEEGAVNCVTGRRLYRDKEKSDLAIVYSMQFYSQQHLFETHLIFCFSNILYPLNFNKSPPPPHNETVKFPILCSSVHQRKVRMWVSLYSVTELQILFLLSSHHWNLWDIQEKIPIKSLYKMYHILFVFYLNTYIPELHLIVRNY
jgi:hypothetical protein